MMKYGIPFALLLLLLGATSWSERAVDLKSVDEDTYVADILATLEQPRRGDNYPRPVPGASAELGEQIVLTGRGENRRLQSKHFVCTSCHNLVPEDPDLTVSDPETRLAFAVANNLPFLPGTTLYGVVNRESYYNDDYNKKYGDLVKPARKDMRAAIQLCATECAQGKPLTDLEMESVVSYLNTIGLKLIDLNLSEREKEKISTTVTGQGDRAATITLLKSKYAAKSPAHFVLPPEDRKAGYPDVTGRPEKGQYIFQKACLHCHENQRYSFYDITEDSYSYNHLLKHFPRYTRYSTYQVVRYGTSPIPGKKAYMPHYTAERMSNQQVEDLRAYLTAAAKK